MKGPAFSGRRDTKLEPATRHADHVMLVFPVPRSGAFMTSHQDHEDFTSRL